MKALLPLLLFLAGTAFADDMVIKSKVYHKVSIMSVSATEVRFMHEDGVAKVPLSSLPPEWLSKLKAPVPNRAAERAEDDRRAEATRQAQAQAAGQAMAANSLEADRERVVNSPTEALQSMLAWCEQNASGGDVPMKDGSVMRFSKARRDQLLPMITAELAKRGAVATAPPVPVEQPFVPTYAPTLRKPEGVRETDWRRYLRTPEGIAAAARAQVPRAASGVIETQINGEFKGFEHGRVFKMIDGSIWEQADLTFEFHYEYSPEVLLIPTDGLDYRMKVKEMDETALVRRVR